MLIATTLFVAACAAVPASSGGETGVLSFTATATTAPAVDPFVDRPAGVASTTTTATITTTIPAEPADASAAERDADEANDVDPDVVSRSFSVAAAPAPAPATVAPASAPAPAPASAPAPAPTPAPAPAPTPAPTTTAPPPPPTTVAPPPPPTTTVPVPYGDAGAAASFVAEINALRGSVGVGGLSRSGDLDSRAQAWATQMAADGSLRHSTIISGLVGGSWNTAGENVGYGPSVGSVFGGLRNSSGHYANMVNGAYTHVGVGVAVVGGTIWTTHLFAG